MGRRRSAQLGGMRSFDRRDQNPYTVEPCEGWPRSNRRESPAPANMGRTCFPGDDSSESGLASMQIGLCRRGLVPTYSAWQAVIAICLRMRRLARKKSRPRIDTNSRSLRSDRNAAVGVETPTRRARPPERPRDDGAPVPSDATGSKRTGAAPTRSTSDEPDDSRSPSPATLRTRGYRLASRRRPLCVEGREVEP